MAEGTDPKEFKFTEDEVKKLSKAMKDPEFHKLLKQYAEEISDPENRRRQEEEIAMLEKERGMNVKFIHPNPCYVIKTSVQGNQKAFINVCTNDNIQQPKVSKETSSDGKAGLHWSIPHCFAPVREDVDKKRERCKVFDVVFHPDTYRMSSNVRFKKMLHDTIFDGIEKQFGMTMDRVNLKYPKLKYKGIPKATVIRTRTSDNGSSGGAMEELGLAYPYDNLTNEEKASERERQRQAASSAPAKSNAAASHAQSSPAKSAPKATSPPADYTVPNYSIKYRDYVDMKEFTYAPDARTSVRPKELIVAIDLPLIDSSNGVNLDVSEKSLKLDSAKPAYRLEFDLPFAVDESKGRAKFDKSTRKLIVTLPVQEASPPPLPSFIDGEPEIGNVANGVEPEQPADAKVPAAAEASPRAARSHGAPAGNSAAEASSDNRDLPAVTAYHVDQDEHYISLVLHAPDVVVSSVRQLFADDGLVELNFSVASSAQRDRPQTQIAHKFSVRLTAQQKLCQDKCQFTVSKDSLIWALAKHDDCMSMWNKIVCGNSPDDYQERYLLCEENLQKEFEMLDILSEPGKQSAESAKASTGSEQLHETQIGEQETTVKVLVAKNPEVRRAAPPPVDHHQPAAAQPSPKRSASPPLRRRHFSADEGSALRPSPPPDRAFFVRHPNGILKQRSCSEVGSDSDSDVEQFGTSARSLFSDGPNSVRADSTDSCDTQSSRRKKSVSFSDKVDMTHFRSNQSVSQMHSALKSKRKRQRKRQERLSGGSAELNGYLGGADKALGAGRGRRRRVLSEGSNSVLFSLAETDYQRRRCFSGDKAPAAPPAPAVASATQRSCEPPDGDDELGEAPVQPVVHSGGGDEIATTSSGGASQLVAEPAEPLPFEITNQLMFETDQ